jgi:hypothetical protein
MQHQTKKIARRQFRAAGGGLAASAVAAPAIAESMPAL